VTCDRCGMELTVGAWPFCPHGVSHQSVIGDDIPGGFVQEHFGHEPETFYSKKAMALRAKELGLEPMVRWAGPNDRHVTQWVAVDLAGAEELIARHYPGGE